jgi:hypothetical protein
MTFLIVGVDHHYFPNLYPLVLVGDVLMMFWLCVSLIALRYVHYDIFMLWELAWRSHRAAFGRKVSLPAPRGIRKPVETNGNHCGNRRQLLETVETGHFVYQN